MFSQTSLKKKRSTFLKFKGCYTMKVKKNVRYNCNAVHVVLYIHSTKLSFIMFNLTVFINIRKNIRKVSLD